MKTMYVFYDFSHNMYYKTSMKSENDVCISVLYKLFV